MICVTPQRLAEMARHRAQGWQAAWEAVAVQHAGRLCITPESAAQLRRDYGPPQVVDETRHAVGVGDVIERLAKPVARWVDRATARLPVRWRTQLAGCRACRKRKAWLNTAPRAGWASIWSRLKRLWRRP